MGIERAKLARACALLGTTALVAAAALALWARTSEAAGPARRVLLVDLSHSVRARWRDAGTVLGRLAASEPGRVVIAYGAEVVRCTGAQVRGLCATLEDSASELDAALEVARAELGADGERSLEILSDGGFTGRDPRPRLAALEREGVGIAWPALPERERSELVLGEPRAGELRAGAPVALELPLALAPAARDTSARTLAIEIEHAGAKTRSTQVLAAPAGLAPDAQGWLAWPLRLELPPLPEGETRVHFALEGEPGSARELVLVPRGARVRAAVLGPTSGIGELAAGPQWIALDAAGLARELENFDLLLTTDASFELLPREPLEAWLERGGAWIACAAPANFPHDWGARGAAALLPLEPAGEGLPPRDVIFLLDGSGSMVGEPWSTARAALVPLSESAGKDERLFARSFAGALGPAQRLGPGVPAANAPGGPTALCDALEALAREPSERERLVLLLSDGEDRGGKDALARAAPIAKALAGARITLAPIAIGADANLELLRALTSPGEELLACPKLTSALDPAALEALFRRQLGGRQWARDLPGLRADSSGTNTLAAALAALGVERPLARCAALRARAGSEVLLWTPEHTPALALSRTGLGWCAAAGFDPAQAAFDPWNTLALSLARPPGERALELVVEAGRVRVERAQAGPSGWIAAELRGPSGKAPLALAQQGSALEAQLAPELERREWDALVLRPGAPDELSLAWPQRLAPEERLPRPAIEASARTNTPARRVPRAGGESALALGLLGLGVACSFLGAALGFFSRARAAAGTKF